MNTRSHRDRTSSLWALAAVLLLWSCTSGGVMQNAEGSAEASRQRGPQQSATGPSSAPPSPVVAQPRASERFSGQAGGWQIDLAAARDLWGNDPPIEKIEDLLLVEVELDGRTIEVGTHLFGEQLRIVPYHDDDSVLDAAGNRVARGDRFLAESFPPGSVGIAVRHQRSRHRDLDADAPSAVIVQEIGLRNTHVEILVGVERFGQPGVVTLNSPQGYELGRFGDANYPMIFYDIEFDVQSPEHQKLLMDNLRAWTLIYDGLLSFPLRYRGNDPLSAHSPARVEQHAVMAVRAIAGDGEARSWFRNKENLLYCSELATLAINSAVLFPLEAEAFVSRVGQDVWQSFLVEVEKHSRGETNRFTSSNVNDLAKTVALDLPIDREQAQALWPWHYKSVTSAPARLAIEPMNLIDVVEHTMLTLFPTTERDEPAAKARAGFLKRMRESVRRTLDVPQRGPKADRYDDLYDQIVKLERTSYGSERNGIHRQRLDSLLEQAREFLCELKGQDGCLFAPPAMFLWIANQEWESRGVDLNYAGHGFHLSLVAPAAPLAEER